MTVLPGLKSRGDGVVMGRGSEVEVHRWVQEELVGRAKEVYPTLVNSSRMLFTVRVAEAGVGRWMEGTVWARLSAAELHVCCLRCDACFMGLQLQAAHGASKRD